MASSTQAKSFTYSEGGVAILLILCVLVSIMIAAKTHDPAMAFHAWLGLAAAAVGVFAVFNGHFKRECNIPEEIDGKPNYQMGPVSFMLNYPDHCVLYRFIPRGITRTDMQLVWFVNGDAEAGVDYDTDKVTWLWDYTTKEDEYIILRNSEGVNSRFFEPGPYHPEFEEVSIDFIDWYLEGLKNAPAAEQ